jgi:Spy/CpxP family protein refolding chaperone
MPKSKLSAFLYLLVVFVSGAVVGALTQRLYMVDTAQLPTTAPPHPRPTPEEVRRHIVSDLTTRVHLDNQQVAELERIMDETRDDWRQIRDKMNAEGHKLHDQQWEKVRNLLRADQKPLYDQWQAEREAERKKREQQDHAKDKK